MYRVRFIKEVQGTPVGTIKEGTEGHALSTITTDDGSFTNVDLGDGVTVTVPTEALENADA